MEQFEVSFDLSDLEGSFNPFRPGQFDTELFVEVFLNTDTMTPEHDGAGYHLYTLDDVAEHVAWNIAIQGFNHVDGYADLKAGEDWIIGAIWWE